MPIPHVCIVQYPMYESNPIAVILSVFYECFMYDFKAKTWTKTIYGSSEMEI